MDEHEFRTGQVKGGPRDPLARHADRGYDSEQAQMDGYMRQHGAKPLGSANDFQHGGVHYKGSSYQHWDWIRDVGLGYHLGNASKYAFRFPNKNGAEDIEKSIHYIDKHNELMKQYDNVTANGDYEWRLRITELTLRLGVENRLSGRQVQILTWIALGEVNAAAAMLQDELNACAATEVTSRP